MDHYIRTPKNKINSIIIQRHSCIFITKRTSIQSQLQNVDVCFFWEVFLLTRSLKTNNSKEKFLCWSVFATIHKTLKEFYKFWTILFSSLWNKYPLDTTVITPVYTHTHKFFLTLTDWEWIPGALCWGSCPASMGRGAMINEQCLTLAEKGKVHVHATCIQLSFQEHSYVSWFSPMSFISANTFKPG